MDNWAVCVISGEAMMKTLQFKRFGKLRFLPLCTEFAKSRSALDVQANWNVRRHLESVVNARAFSAFQPQAGVCAVKLLALAAFLSDKTEGQSECFVLRAPVGSIKSLCVQVFQVTCCFVDVAQCLLFFFFFFERANLMPFTGGAGLVEGL